jgi:hypothetical protein
MCGHRVPLVTSGLAQVQGTWTVLLGHPELGPQPLAVEGPV